MRKIATILLFFCSLTLSPGICGAAVSMTRDVSQRAEALLLSGKYDQLDAMARSLGEQDVRFPGGDPELHAFHMALGAISDASCGCWHGDIPFAVKRPAAEKWLSADPKSPAAHLTLALLWINYAWTARGGDYATRVSPQQWSDYHDRLQTASRYAAGVDPKADVFVLYVRSLLAEATPLPRETIVAAYDAMIAADPRWFPIYARQAEMLKLKWYGEQGELVRFAKSLLQAKDIEIGQTAYAENATAFVGGIAYNDGFAAVGDDWPALKQTYATKEKRYGLSEDDAYALLQYAALFHDQETIGAALQHMRDYAQRGFSLDMNNLGWTYLHGIGVPVERDLAVSWYREGAADGNDVSEYQLGTIFGDTPGQAAEALKWYGLAGANGNPTALNNMGVMFENGRGVTQDYPKAADLYKRAAAAGEPRGEFHLATLYDRGLGVEKDENLALTWMTKAAQDGDRDARAWMSNRTNAGSQPDNTP